MLEWDTLWDAALPGCWSSAVPLGNHFSPLRVCLGQVAFHHPAVRFCDLFVKGSAVPCWKHYTRLRGHGHLEACPIPLTSSPTASKCPDEPGCTLQGQSPKLFSVNETTLSLAWKECLGAFFLFNEEVLQDSYNTVKYH